MNQFKPAETFILHHKTAAMQRLADLVRTGHRFHVSGTVSPEKVQGLAKKFTGLYQTNQTRLQASRQRKTGEASFRLLLQGKPDATEIRWWLLRTDGEMPEAAKKENWADATQRGQHIEWDGYELVRHTREGANNPSWSWRYTKEQEASLRDGLVNAIRTHRDDHLRQLIDSIHRTPGFALAREQVKKMRKLITDEWKRRGRDGAPPEMPGRVGYVQRLADVGHRVGATKDRKRGVRRVK